MPALLVAPDDRVVAWNPAAAQLLGGGGPGREIGRTSDDSDDLSRLPAVRDAVLESRRAHCHAVRDVTLRGSARDAVRISVSPVAEPAGFVLVVVEDRAELAAAQRLDRSKHEFLAMLAHELRNPLAPILSAMHVLHRRVAADTTAQRARLIVERQVRHLARLLDDLLDLSRVTQGTIELRRERVDLVKVAVEALEMAEPVTRHGRHTVRTDFVPGGVVVQGDRARLLQVVTNLLTNAAKYTGPGGVITLSVQVDGGEAVLRVKDTGIGIPREMLPRVFDLFMQVEPSIDRARGGLGIGLTLVRRIVEMHGGSVVAASDGPGTGSEFTIRLPRSTAAPPGQVAPDAGAAAAGQLRVLVVEDNGDSRDMLRTALQMDGHHVMAAADGLDAAVIAADFEPEVVLLDIGLPGIDGYEVARRLRTILGRRAVIVALTGYGDDEAKRRIAAAGFDVHLLKPIAPEDLARLFRDVIRRRT